MDIILNPAPSITSVNTAGGFPDVAQNDWVEIKGTGLAPSTIGPNGMTWGSAPEFAQGRMPIQLGGVTVTVGGRAAYVYYVSETQINALTPLDNTQGQTSIIVANASGSSAPFGMTVRGVAPSFLLFGATRYVVATHANGSLLGPVSMSAPGYMFSPAQPGETVVLYGVGFGLPTTALGEGSAIQLGTLATAPVIQIGGTTAEVQFAGVISPGLYQFNVVVPGTAANGDNSVTASYGGFAVPAGTLVAVQR